MMRVPGRLVAVVFAVLSAGVGSAAAAGVGVPAQQAPMVEPCPEPARSADPSAAPDVRDVIVGAWIRCGDDSFPPPHGVGNEVGIEFAADGAWYRLYEENGALLRVEGLAQQGIWEIPFEETSQLNVSIAGGGSVFTNATIRGGEPTLMQVPHSGGPAAAFVRWTGDPPEPGTPVALRDQPCGLPTGPVELDSVADARQRLVGVWVRCSSASAFDPPRPGQVGIEIADDGRFHRLYDDGDGGLIRASGGTEQGRWAVIDNLTGGEWPGGGWPGAGYQLDLTLTGTRSGATVFFEEPLHLRFSDFGPVDYQAWTGPPPVAGDPPVRIDQPAPALPVTGSSNAAAAVALGVAALLAGGLLVGLARQPRRRVR